MPLRVAECADGTQIVIYVLQTISSLQGIITSWRHLVHSCNIMMAQEKKAFGIFCQDAIHPEIEISFFFLRLHCLFSINNSIPDIFCQ